MMMTDDDYKKLAAVVLSAALGSLDTFGNRQMDNISCISAFRALLTVLGHYPSQSDLDYVTDRIEWFRDFIYSADVGPGGYSSACFQFDSDTSSFIYHPDATALHLSLADDSTYQFHDDDLKYPF